MLGDAGRDVGADPASTEVEAILSGFLRAQTFAKKASVTHRPKPWPATKDSSEGLSSEATCPVSNSIGE